MAVDLVGEDDDVGVLCDDVDKCAELVGGVYASGGVARGADEDHAGARRDGAAELVGGDLEVLLDAGGDEDGLAFGELNHLDVADPCGCGDYDFVAGVDCGEDDVAEGLLGAVTDDNLRGVVDNAFGGGDVVDDGLAQREVARDGSVTGEVLVDGGFCGLLDVERSVEIGFTNGEVDDVDAHSLEFLAFL